MFFRNSRANQISIYPCKNYSDVNVQKRLMVPMPKMKLPDLSKLRLQDSFIGKAVCINFIKFLIMYLILMICGFLNLLQKCYSRVHNRWNEKFS